MAVSRNDQIKKRDKKPPTQEQRKKYQTDQKITDTHQGIIRLANSGKFSQSTTISKMDTKESIPVVVRLLLQIQEVLADELTKSQDKATIEETQRVVHDAICIFHETVETLNLGATAKLSYLNALDPEQTIGELEILVADIERITVTPATEKLWDETSLWMDGIYRRTADKIPKGPKPCQLLLSSVSPSLDNVAELGLVKLQAAYVRTADLLFYVDRESKTCDEIKMTKSQLMQFDQVHSRVLTDKELKQIKTMTGHDGKRGSQLVVLASPPDQNNPEDLHFIAADVAYVRRGEDLFYVNKAQNENEKLPFVRDNLEKFDKYMKTPVGVRVYTEKELEHIGALTGHAHPKAVVPLRDQTGSFPRVDWLEDGVLYKATNYKLTKMEISLYYHQAASTITNRLEQFKAKKVVAPARPVVKPVVLPVAKPVASPVAKPIAVPVAKPVAEKVAEPVVQQAVEAVVEKVPELVDEKAVEPVVEKAATAVVEKIPELVVEEAVEPIAKKVVVPAMEPVVEQDDALLASEYIENFPSVTENDTSILFSVNVAKRYGEYLQEICNVVNDMLSNPLVEELKKDIDSDNEQARLYNFQSALSMHHLSPSQKASLSNFREDAIAAITRYTNQRNKWHNYLFKTHQVDALNAINTLKATEDTEDHLNVMLRLYRDMYTQSSEGLFKEVSVVLMTALERLCPNNQGHHLTGKTSIQSENVNSITLCIEVPKGQETFLQEIIDLVNEMLDNPLLALLKKDVASHDERLRLSNFQSALSRFNLNYIQKGMLANFREDAISELSKYVNAKDTWRSLFVNKAHADKALEMIKTLEQASNDPREHLMEMFSLHREMYGQTSVGLYKNINDLLLRTLQRLCPKPHDAELRLSSTAVKSARSNSLETDALPSMYGLKK